MEWTDLRPRVIRRVKPGEEEERRVAEFSERLLVDINGLLSREGFKAVAELHGSVAHGTWNRGREDLDLFIVLSREYTRGDLLRVLETLKRHLDGDYVEAYAEHPYLKASIEGFNVDVVPCFKLEKGGRIKSSTDRTPLHSEYLGERLSDELKDEIRILKQFMEGIGVYGAEIRVRGFSGYLCELLVLRYGSFMELLRAAGEWRKREVIQLGTEQDEAELRKRFSDPLILVDPVDETRNVASALNLQSMWLFVAAARRFTENPGEHYFFHVEETSKEDVLGLLDGRGTDLLFLVIDEHVAEVPDTLWGQLHKSRQAMRNALAAGGFNVLRASAWSNERNRHVFVYELESATIPGVEKRQGPPVSMRSNSESFLESHLGAEATMAGPWVERDRWAALVRRRHVDARSLLHEKLVDGGRDIGVSRNLAIRVLQHHRILLNSEIADYLEDGFESHLYWMLKGRPRWLE